MRKVDLYGMYLNGACKRAVKGPLKRGTGQGGMASCRRRVDLD